MTWLRSRLDALVSRLVAAVGPQDDAHLKRARFFIAFALILLGICPVYGLLYLSLGMWLSAAGVFVGAVIFALALVVFRRTGSIPLGINWLAFGGLIALGDITLFTGGIASPVIGWFALIPVSALILAGLESGLRWTGVALVTVAVFTAIDMAGLTPASEVPVAALAVLRAMVLLGLLALLAWLTIIYERNRDRMLADMRTIHGELELARDDARAAHRAARLVLDNVDQAFVTVDRDGRVGAERSRATTTLLGPIAAGAHLPDVFRARAPDVADWLELGWSDLFEDVLPAEVAVAQLPARCELDSRHLTLTYILVGAPVTRVLVVVTNVSAAVRAHLAEAENKEQFDVFRWFQRDPAFVAGFTAEAEALVAGLDASDREAADERRNLHTLKGNAGILGLGRLAAACNRVEDELTESRSRLDDAQRRRVTGAWRDARRIIDPLLGSRDGDALAIDRRALDQLLVAIGRATPHEALETMVRAWSREPAETYLVRLAEQTRALAARYEIEAPRIVVESNGVRLPPGDWGPFWNATIHVVRNAIDHGIEPAGERRDAGKPPVGEIAFRAACVGGSVVVEIADDGRGIDWDGVRRNASALRLPTEKPGDLVAALFHDGVTTRAVATELSGRGVGMGAIAAATRALGGTLEIDSARGRGTTYRFRFPGIQCGRTASQQPAPELRPAA